MQEDQSVNTLRNHQMFAGVSEKDLSALIKKVDVESYKRYDPVFRSASDATHLIMVLTGLVKTSAKRGSRELILNLAMPGTLLCTSALLRDHVTKAGVYAETILPSELAFIPREALFALCDKYPTMAWSLMHSVLEQQHSAEKLAARVALMTVPERIAYSLGYLVESLGKGVDVVTIKGITHNDVAAMSGSTRETTTLILNDYKAVEAVEIHNRKLRILDQSKLTAVPLLK